jgi:hypothetical protein
MKTNQLTDDDYKLTDGAAWIEVKNFAIRIHSTDEGVIVDIFKNEEYAEAIASTYAFDTETTNEATA